MQVRKEPFCTNFTLRFLYETLLEICICAMINISIIDFSDKDITQHWVLSAVVLVLVLVFVCWLLSLFCCNGPFLNDFWQPWTSIKSLFQARAFDLEYIGKKKVLQLKKDQIKDRDKYKKIKNYYKKAPKAEVLPTIVYEEIPVIPQAQLKTEAELDDQIGATDRPLLQGKPQETDHSGLFGYDSNQDYLKFAQEKNAQSLVQESEDPPENLLIGKELLFGQKLKPSNISLNQFRSDHSLAFNQSLQSEKDQKIVSVNNDSGSDALSYDKNDAIMNTKRTLLSTQPTVNAELIQDPVKIGSQEVQSVSKTGTFRSAMNKPTKQPVVKGKKKSRFVRQSTDMMLASIFTNPEDRQFAKALSQKDTTSNANTSEQKIIDLQKKDSQAVAINMQISSHHVDPLMQQIEEQNSSRGSKHQNPSSNNQLLEGGEKEDMKLMLNFNQVPVRTRLRSKFKKLDHGIVAESAQEIVAGDYLIEAQVKRYKTLFYGLKVNHPRNVASLYPLLFTLRRITYAVGIVILSSIPFTGIWILLSGTVCMLAYSLVEWQWQDEMLNWINLFNEFTLYWVCISLLMFSQYNSAETRVNFGYYLLYVFFAFIVCNMYVILFIFVHNVKMWIKRATVLYRRWKLLNEIYEISHRLYLSLFGATSKTQLIVPKPQVIETSEKKPEDDENPGIASASNSVVSKAEEEPAVNNVFDDENHCDEDGLAEDSDQGPESFKDDKGSRKSGGSESSSSKHEDDSSARGSQSRNESSYEESSYVSEEQVPVTPLIHELLEIDWYKNLQKGHVLEPTLAATTHGGACGVIVEKLDCSFQRQMFVNHMQMMTQTMKQSFRSRKKLDLKAMMLKLQQDEGSYDHNPVLKKLQDKSLKTPVDEINSPTYEGNQVLKKLRDKPLEIPVKEDPVAPQITIIEQEQETKGDMINLRGSVKIVPIEEVESEDTFSKAGSPTKIKKEIFKTDGVDLDLGNSIEMGDRKMAISPRMNSGEPKIQNREVTGQEHDRFQDGEDLELAYAQPTLDKMESSKISPIKEADPNKIVEILDDSSVISSSSEEEGEDEGGAFFCAGELPEEEKKQLERLESSINGSKHSMSPRKLSDDSIVTETDINSSVPLSVAKSETKASSPQLNYEKTAIRSVTRIQDSESNLNQKQDFAETQFTLERQQSQERREILKKTQDSQNESNSFQLANVKGYGSQESLTLPNDTYLTTKLPQIVEENSSSALPLPVSSEKKNSRADKPSMSQSYLSTHEDHKNMAAATQNHDDSESIALRSMIQAEKDKAFSQACSYELQREKEREMKEKTSYSSMLRQERSQEINPYKIQQSVHDAQKGKHTSRKQKPVNQEMIKIMDDKKRSTSLRDQLSVEKAKTTKSERKVPKVQVNNVNYESNARNQERDNIPRIFNVGVKPKKQGQIIDDFPFPIDENLQESFFEKQSILISANESNRKSKPSGQRTVQQRLSGGQQMNGQIIDTQNTDAHQFNTSRAAARKSAADIDIFNMSSNDDVERRKAQTLALKKPSSLIQQSQMNNFGSMVASYNVGEDGRNMNASQQLMVNDVARDSIQSIQVQLVDSVGGMQDGPYGLEQRYQRFQLPADSSMQDGGFGGIGLMERMSSPVQNIEGRLTVAEQVNLRQFARSSQPKTEQDFITSPLSQMRSIGAHSIGQGMDPFAQAGRQVVQANNNLTQRSQRNSVLTIDSHGRANEQ